MSYRYDTIFISYIAVNFGDFSECTVSIGWVL